MAGTTRKATCGAAVAMTVAVVALLVAAAAAQDCRNQGKVVSACAASCVNPNRPAPPSGDCCGALRGADLDCLCGKYSALRSSRYAGCAKGIPSKCGIAVPSSCY